MQERQNSVDYRQAYIRALRGGGEFPDEEYWKALGLIVGTAADSVSGQFGKDRAEVLADIAAWASVEGGGIDGD